MKTARMSLVLIISLILIIGTVPVYIQAENPIQQSIYVYLGRATNGTGTRTAPFNNLRDARLMVREINSNMTGDIIVYMRGTEYLTNTAAFTESDGGTNGYDVIYKKWDENEAVISGGKLISGWTLYDSSKNIYCATTDLTDFRQLYINGNRAVRARSADGMGITVNSGNTGCTVSGTGMAAWNNITDVDFVFKYRFINPRCQVQGVSTGGGRTTFTFNPIIWDTMVNGYGEYMSFTSGDSVWYVENAYELLDAENEWYFDKTAGMVYYKPASGTDMSSAEAVAPQLEHIITLAGSSSAKASHIKFDNIIFSHSSWLYPSVNKGFTNNQNNVVTTVPNTMPTGGLTVSYADNITFNECEFSHMGITGLHVSTGSDNIQVTGSEFHDISGNGMNFGEIADLSSADAVSNVTVSGNTVHDIGVDYRSSSGISAMYIKNGSFQNNELYNLPFNGFDIGWGWAYQSTSVTTNVKIQYNHIHDIMKECLDGGAVYVLGATDIAEGAKGIYNEISYNYMERMYQGDGSGAIYLDNGSKYWYVHDNVINQAGVTDTSAYWFSGAYDASNNIIEDNYYNTFSYTYNRNTDGAVICRNNFYTEGAWPTWVQQIADSVGVSGTQPATDAGRLILDSDMTRTGGTVRVTAEDLAMDSGGSAAFNEDVYGKTVKLMVIPSCESEVLSFEAKDGGGIKYAVVFDGNNTEIYENDARLYWTNDGLAAGCVNRIYISFISIVGGTKISVYRAFEEICSVISYTQPEQLQISIRTDNLGCAIGGLKLPAANYTAYFDQGALIANSGFSQSTSGWNAYEGGTLSYNSTDQCAEFTQTDNNSSMVYGAALSWVKDKEYELSAEVKLDSLPNGAAPTVYFDIRSPYNTAVTPEPVTVDGMVTYEMSEWNWYRTIGEVLTGTDTVTVKKYVTISGGFDNIEAFTANLALLVRDESGTQIPLSYSVDNINAVEANPDKSFSEINAETDTNCIANGMLEESMNGWNAGENVTLEHNTAITDGSAGSLKVSHAYNSYNSYAKAQMNIAADQWYKISANVYVEGYMENGSLMPYTGDASCRFYIENMCDAVSSSGLVLHYYFQDSGKYWYKDSEYHKLKAGWNQVVSYVKLGAQQNPKLMLMVKQLSGGAEVSFNPAYVYDMDSIRVENVNMPSLVNGSFEQGTFGWHGRYANSVTSTNTCSYAQSGSSCYVSGLTYGFGHLRQTVYLETGGTYTISAKIKIDTTDYQSAAYAQLLPFVYIYYRDTPICGNSGYIESNDWVTRSYTFTWTQENAANYGNILELGMGTFANDSFYPYYVDGVEMYTSGSANGVVNPNFAGSLDGWSMNGSGQAIADGVYGAKIVQNNVTDCLRQYVAVTAGTTYSLCAEIENDSAQSVSLQVCAGDIVIGEGTVINGSNTMTVCDTVTFDETGGIYVYADVQGESPSVYHIKHLSLVPVDEDDARVYDVSLSNRYLPSYQTESGCGYALMYRYLAKEDGVWSAVKSGYINMSGSLPVLNNATGYEGIPVQLEIRPYTYGGVYMPAVRSGIVESGGSFTVNSSYISLANSMDTALDDAASGELCGVIHYLNTSGEDITGNVIVAAYEGDTLLSASVKPMTLYSNDMANRFISNSVTTEDNADKVCMFIWDKECSPILQPVKIIR